MNKKMLTLSLAVLVLCATAIARVPSGDEANMTFSSVSSGAKLDLYNGGQTKINVPETHGGADVTTISATAFTDPAIEMIYLPITTTTVEENAFLNCGDDVIVILELSDPLADVPTDVAKWGMGDYTAEIRYFTDTGRTDLFIVKGEIEPEEIGECSNLKEGRMSDLIFESNLSNTTSYTGITYTKDKTPPADAYNIALDQQICSRGYDDCIVMWAEGTEIYIWFCGDSLIMYPNVRNYFTTYCGAHPVDTNVLADMTHISGLEYLDTSKVTDMSEMFCQHGNPSAKVERLNLSSFDTSNVTAMGYMFGTNSALIDLDISSFDTSNVYDMHSMFYKVSSLEKLDLSHFDTSNVWLMFSMFDEMDSLKELNLSGFDFSSVGNTEGMFYGLANLEKIDFTNVNTSNVYYMSYMFDGTAALKDLDLSSFDTSAVWDMNQMFSGASSLTTLDLRLFDMSNVTNDTDMFSGATSLNTVTVKDSATETIMRSTTNFPTQIVNFVIAP